MENLYDLVIVGGGPSGLTSAIYATRANLKCLIIEKGVIGGQTSLTHSIDNYPALNGVQGYDLTNKMYEHAIALGAKFLNEEVVKLELNGKIKKIYLKDKTIEAKAVVLALGAKARKLNVAGEDKYINLGVNYCAVCDGALYKGKDVVVVGGGNSAVEDALYLFNIAKSVTIINKSNDFTCWEHLKEQINALIESKKVKVYHNSVVTKIIGDKKVNAVEIKYKNFKNDIKTDGVFVAIGRTPEIEILKDTKIQLDKYGYVVSNENMETNIKGVYVCGDVRTKEVRQIITACADGAIASTIANKYIKKNFK